MIEEKLEEPQTEIYNRSHFDEAWKEALQRYFKEFAEFCWQEAYEQIDWSRGYEFLEQEFHTVLIEDNGKRLLDKLIKVWLKTGIEQWILIHIEVQGKTAYFSERMYVYRYRIYDRFQKNAASLAILIDDDINWRPNVYESSQWGSTTKLQYPILKILDFKDSSELLEKSNNPFALIILAQLATLETKKEGQSRLTTKIGLTRKLFKHGWTGEQIYSLYRFLDGIMTLPESLELTYNESVKKIEGEHQMSFMTTAERCGFKMGMQHGEATLLLALLKTKFTELPEDYINKINSADTNTLNHWAVNFVSAQSLDDVFK